MPTAKAAPKAKAKVRVKPKMIVSAITGDNVDLFGWGDRVGFVSEPDVPVAFLVWPRVSEPVDPEAK